MTPSFDCATAPTVLGHPEGTVSSCSPVYSTSNLWFVRLDVPGVGLLSRLVLATQDGPFAGLGLAALGRYLEESSLDHEKSLTEASMLWFVKAAEAYPPGWSGMDGAGELPGIGVATVFQADPIALTLYRPVRSAPLPRESIGLPPPESRAPTAFERAVLQRGTDGFAWTISSGAPGGWSEQAKYSLR